MLKARFDRWQLTGPVSPLSPLLELHSALSALCDSARGACLFCSQDPVTKDKCPWFGGPSLFQTLDALEPQDRDKDAPFRMPVLDKHRDMGTIIMGKTEVRLAQPHVYDNTTLLGDQQLTREPSSPSSIDHLHPARSTIACSGAARASAL